MLLVSWLWLETQYTTKALVTGCDVGHTTQKTMYLKAIAYYTFQNLKTGGIQY